MLFISEQRFKIFSSHKFDGVNSTLEAFFNRQNYEEGNCSLKFCLRSLLNLAKNNYGSQKGLLRKEP